MDLYKGFRLSLICTRPSEFAHSSPNMREYQDSGWSGGVPGMVCVVGWGCMGTDSRTEQPGLQDSILQPHSKVPSWIFGKHKCWSFVLVWQAG